MKNLILRSSIALAVAGATQAATINLTPMDITFASSSTTLATPGTVTRGNSDQIEVRTRTANQVATDNRTVATFVNFDASLATLGIASGAEILSATIQITYNTQLNNVNPSDPAAVGRVVSPWDTSGTNNPLFTYGYDHTGPATAAQDVQVLVADIQNTAPSGQALTADFTSVVQNWVDGTTDNNGLVFFINGLGSQGAGFNNLNLEVVTIPEPSSLALAGFGLFGLLARRRR